MNIFSLVVVFLYIENNNIIGNHCTYTRPYRDKPTITTNATLLTDVMLCLKLERRKYILLVNMNTFIVKVIDAFHDFDRLFELIVFLSM